MLHETSVYTRLIYNEHLRTAATIGVPGGGAEGAAAPPVCWANKASRQVRFTVGQYWLIIKINGTNFVGNSVNFVRNMLSNRNFS